MDNIRKINSLLGSIITDINNKTTDEEIDEFANSTFGDVAIYYLVLAGTLGEVIDERPELDKMNFLDNISIFEKIVEEADKDAIIEKVDKLIKKFTEES